MSKNNIILIIVLIVLVVALWVIRYTSDPRERRVRFFDLNPESISMIEISTARDTLVISHDGVEWSIEHPFYFSIDKNRLDSFFSQVLPVETSSIPVALSEESFTNYQLTEERGTRLKFYDSQNNLLDSALIGRSGRSAFARRPDDNRIFQLMDNISFIVSPTLAAWRNNQIVGIPRGAIEDIEVKYQLNHYKITATDSLWHFSDDTHSFSIPENNSSFRQLLNKIESMNSFGFKDFEFEEYASILAEPQLILNISKIDGNKTTLIFAYTEEENFVVQRNELTDHLFIIDADTVDLFTRAPQHFQ
jgi:hypothetical protein